jgi:hypothetical protein
LAQDDSFVDHPMSSREVGLAFRGIVRAATVREGHPFTLIVDSVDVMLLQFLNALDVFAQIFVAPFLTIYVRL